MADNQTLLPPFSFACPACRMPLEWITPKQQLCPQDGSVYSSAKGIWRFLPRERLKIYVRFVQEYEEVRRLEGRGFKDPEDYRALPFVRSNRKDPGGWKIRARSYSMFLEQILTPLETQAQRPLLILDLGAGSGWLAYRMAQRRHLAAAVDLLVNDFDGLGVHRQYDAYFTPVQAEFDRLPLTGGQFDLAVFNASFHYSTDTTRTLREALRVLRPEAPIVILDTPIYQNDASGQQMVHEREAQFTQRFGFPSNALPSKNYLTHHELADLGRQLNLEWQTLAPSYGLRWALRPMKARLLGRREPAQFRLLAGRRTAGTRN